MKTRFLIPACLLLVGQLAPLLAQDVPQRQRPMTLALPDLMVRQYQFPPTNNKGLRVFIGNAGKGAAGASVLRLTIRKINGVAVGRTLEKQVDAIAAVQSQWVTIDASSILPQNVSLKQTTFKINLDVGEQVSETNEKNNEKWHNL